jgi:hypothetical protein
LGTCKIAIADTSIFVVKKQPFMVIECPVPKMEDESGIDGDAAFALKPRQYG